MNPTLLRDPYVRLFLAFALTALAACSGTEAPGTFCPTLDDQGPVLSPDSTYILVAHGLSEDWIAGSLSGTVPDLLSEPGLTGRTPNDMDVVDDKLYVVNSGDNTISVIDLSSGFTTGCIEVGTGTNPWEFMVDPTNPERAWVTTFLSGEILELDLPGTRVLRRRTIEPAMEGLFVTDSLVMVTLTGFEGTEGGFGEGSVAVLDKQTLDELRRLPVPTNPQFLFRGADGNIHVVCSGNFDISPSGISGQVARLTPDGSAVLDTLSLGGSPARAALAPDGTAFVTAFFGGLMAYDSMNFTVLNDINNPISPETGFTDVMVTGGTAYAANFDVDAILVVDVSTRSIDVSTRSIVGDLLVRDGPIAVALYPR